MHAVSCIQPTFIILCLYSGLSSIKVLFALLLRPNKDHKIRIYWSIYHYMIRYTTIIISIFNIFKGFEALQVSVQECYNDCKHACIGIIAESKTAIGINGTNGVNGYGSISQH
ncbi:hypothetical protein Lal_00038800, partial [Lupinus albus]